MKRSTLAAAVLCLCALMLRHAAGASQYLYVPSIADSSSVPGYGGVMPLQSTTIVGDLSAFLRAGVYIETRS